MQEAISEWWALPKGTAGKFYEDSAWDPAGKPPVASISDADHKASSYSTVNAADGSGARTPVVPWYTSKWMTGNPSCRGYPWY